MKGEARREKEKEGKVTCEEGGVLRGQCTDTNGDDDDDDEGDGKGMRALYVGVVKVNVRGVSVSERKECVKRSGNWGFVCACVCEKKTSGVRDGDRRRRYI